MAARASGIRGFTEHDTEIEGARLHYAEGPPNGPALLLIHGQVVDWTTYRRALPTLSRHFHVFAVDCYGHGRSARVPQRYSNLAMGRDLARFLREVVGPAYVSGNSSGGLLAITVTLEAPDLVRGLVLEDPPLFSSVYPRFVSTFGYDLPRSAHAFLASGADDFASWYVADSALIKLFGKLAPRMIASAQAQRSRGEPISWWYMPSAMNDLFGCLQFYDPAFGDAFYTGRWHDGFDHADALSRLAVPTVLMHADWKLGADGILQGAMDDAEAARARSLIPGVDFRRVHAGHAVHADKPRLFTDIVLEHAGMAR